MFTKNTERTSMFNIGILCRLGSESLLIEYWEEISSTLDIFRNYVGSIYSQSFTEIQISDMFHIVYPKSWEESKNCTICGMFYLKLASRYLLPLWKGHLSWLNPIDFNIMPKFFCLQFLDRNQLIYLESENRNSEWNFKVDKIVSSFVVITTFCTLLPISKFGTIAWLKHEKTI